MLKAFSHTSILALLSLGLLACGGGGGGSIGSGSSTVAPGTVSFAVSDAPVEGLSEVVITINGMELRRKDGGDCDDDPGTGDCVFINDFTDGGEDDTITVDLLDLQDGENKIIVEGLELEAGEYDQLRLSIIDEDINFSWVKETADADVLKELKVPSDELKLGGFIVERGGEQVFVIEFDLRKAMTYNPGSKDRYILKPTGVRVVEVEAAASISGVVASELFSGNGAEPCVLKDDVNVGNVIYLYQGHDLNENNLADNFDSTVDVDAPDTAIAPYTSQKVAADGSYGVFYLPAGDYTLAFTCAAEADDPDLLDGIVIPSPATVPATAIVELSLDEGESKACDLPVVGGDC